MRLGIRLLFAFFLINGIAAFFVLRVFTAEIKPSVRQAMEDMLIDTANILAEMASDDLAAGTLGVGRFGQHVRNYALRPVDASIWGFAKQSLDFRVYVTDTRGMVLFDSENRSVGQDFSAWNDVARTLRGQYGARASREVSEDASTGVMYVAAPVMAGGKIAGVLTVAKPTRTVQRFIDRAERKVLTSGVWLLGLSAAVGVLVTLWTVWNIRKLRHYALSVQLGQPMAVPQVPGELGELARAMDHMRLRLEGRDYVENYVRALTHELKSPMAAIRGAGELMQDDLPAADRQAFATQVVQQTERVQRLIDRLLELSKLEQRPAVGQHTPVSLMNCAQTAAAHCSARASQRGMLVQISGHGSHGAYDADLVTLAITNLLDNALDFSADGGLVQVRISGSRVTVEDNGPGVPDYALPRLGERFFTTARPDGARTGSGLGLAIVRQVMALHGGMLVVGNTGHGLRAELVFLT